MKKIINILKDCVEFLKMDISLKTKGYYIVKSKKTKNTLLIYQ